jgi:hypothetical protein
MQTRKYQVEKRLFPNDNNLNGLVVSGKSALIVKQLAPSIYNIEFGLGLYCT